MVFLLFDLQKQNGRFQDVQSLKDDYLWIISHYSHEKS